MDGFFYVVVAHLAALHQGLCLCGAGETVKKKIQVPDEMKGGFLWVVDNVVHLPHHLLPQVFGAGAVDGVVF